MRRSIRAWVAAGALGVAGLGCERPDAAVPLGVPLHTLSAAAPGSGGSFSLTAHRNADGTATGQWDDELAPGVVVRVAINCVVAEGNQTWVGGVVTASDVGGYVGVETITRVLHDGAVGTRADSLSYSFFATGGCTSKPPLPLFAPGDGRVTIE